MADSTVTLDLPAFVNAQEQNLTIEQALTKAYGHWNAGQSRQAEFLCRQVLVAWPDNASALHLLGLMAYSGDHLDATNIFAAGGPAFDTRGIRPARGTVDMGARLKYQTAGSWEFTANYDFQYKSDYTSNAGFLHATYKF